MTIVSEIQQRLRAIDPAVFAIVDGAGALAAVKGRPTAVPAAYVFIREEAAGENDRMTGPVHQRVAGDVAIVVVTENLSDAGGAAVAGELEGLKAAVVSALLGFVPTVSQDGTPLEYVSGQVVKFLSGCIWHEQLFSAAWYIEETI